MKTKPFLLATAGSTVDGRTIDDKMLEEMASSYDPKTYGARLNIEHIRGLGGDGPFRAFGDVLELSIGETEVNFNGRAEKRKALFGVFDVTPDAKKLNQASQKVYPSIEIEPNFGGKGFAYMTGCALTDSPASIATERLQFNRALPGTLSVALDEPALLEFPDDPAIEGGTALLSSLKNMFDGFAAKFGPARSDPKPDGQPGGGDGPATGFDFAQIRPLFEEFSTAIVRQIDGLRTEFRQESDALAVRVKKLHDQAEEAPAPNFRARPQGGHATGSYAGIF